MVSEGYVSSEARVSRAAGQRSVSGPGVVAITGIHGWLGGRLLARLARGAGVRVVGLDERRPMRLEERTRFHRLDLSQPTADGSLARILEKERVDVVVHAAFRADPTPDLEMDHELETIGSLHVMHACAAAKVKRLVVASSTMLYGPHPDNPNFLSETHPLRGHPQAHAVRDRIAMEALLAEWAQRHPDVEVTVLRTGWIFGPEYWNRVVAYFALPVVAVPLGYDPLMQVVHEEDVLRAFEQAALRPHPGVFNVVAPGVLPLSTLLRLAGKRVLRLPSALLYRLAYFPSQAQTGDPPAAFYDYLRYLWVADGRKGWGAFGEPYYSTKEAWISFVSSRRMRRYR
jgi:UDP-glucose 4-epimerase